MTSDFVLSKYHSDQTIFMSVCISKAGARRLILGFVPWPVSAAQNYSRLVRIFVTLGNITLKFASFTSPSNPVPKY